MPQPGVRDLGSSSVPQHAVLHALHAGVLSNLGAIGRLVLLHLCRHSKHSQMFYFRVKTEMQKDEEREKQVNASVGGATLIRLQPQPNKQLVQKLRLYRAVK